MTAFIFDLDGTLADTIPLIHQTTRLALARFGLTASEAEITSFIGIPLVVVGAHFLGDARKEEYMQAFYEYYQQFKGEVKAFPDLQAMLAQLRDAGAKLGVATSKRKGPAFETLETIGLLEFFSVVVHSESGCGFKPGPGPAEHTMRELGSESHHSWFIGDSVHDIACAKAAGIRSVAVSWGVYSRDQLAEAEPEYVCETVVELHALLLKLHCED